MRPSCNYGSSVAVLLSGEFSLEALVDVLDGSESLAYPGVSRSRMALGYSLGTRENSKIHVLQNLQPEEK